MSSLFQAITSFDHGVLEYLNQTIVSPDFDSVAVLFSHPWLWWSIATLVFLLCLFRSKGSWRILVAAILAISLTDAVCARVIKPTVARLRPCVESPVQVRAIAGCAGKYGFPSNHAANGMALTAVALMLASFRVTSLMLMATLLVGLSRIYLGMHYASDVLGGYLVGGTIGWVVSRIVEAFHWRRYSRRWAGG